MIANVQYLESVILWPVFLILFAGWLIWTTRRRP